MDNSLQNELRQKMRELRDIGGYSQKDMADAMEITQPSFFKVQNGEIELSFKHILGCSELFCVTPIEFISLSTEELSGRISRKSPFSKKSSWYRNPTSEPTFTQREFPCSQAY